jgi:tRNA-dihydrouridine synthase B
MLAASGAAAVMIGRAAVGRPWLVGEIAAGLAGRAWRPPDAVMRARAAVGHVESLLVSMGARHGLRHARKHLAAYALHAGADEATRRAVVTTDDVATVLTALGRIFEQCEEITDKAA